MSGNKLSCISDNEKRMIKSLDRFADESEKILEPDIYSQLTVGLSCKYKKPYAGQTRVYKKSFTEELPLLRQLMTEEEWSFYRLSLHVSEKISNHIRKNKLVVQSVTVFIQSWPHLAELMITNDHPCENNIFIRYGKLEGDLSEYDEIDFKYGGLTERISTEEEWQEIPKKLRYDLKNVFELFRKELTQYTSTR